MHINLFEPKVQTLQQVVENLNFEIPTFQRGVVWSRNQMITLVDSIYRGIPINSLYIWNQKGVLTKSGEESNEDTQLVVDGQQRITSLKGMLLGDEFYNADGRVQRIQVAFNPIREEFRNVDSKFDPDDKWIGNIAKFYKEPCAEKQAYLDRNEGKLTGDETEKVEKSLSRLKAIKELPIVIYEISNEANLDEVYLCFERTNSSGTKVEKGDLCMAWLETYQPLLAEGITLFSEGIQFSKQKAKTRKESPEFKKTDYAEAINWVKLETNRSSSIYQPKPGQLADLLFHIVQDGKKFDLGTIARELIGTGKKNQEVNQGRVKKAFLDIVNDNHFNRVDQILVQLAGIGQTECKYAYWLFINCRQAPKEKGYNNAKIARMLQRWYLLQLLSGIRVTGAAAFSKYLNGFVEAGGLENYLATMESEFSGGFWQKTLPEKLVKANAQETRKLSRAWETVQILSGDKALFDDTLSILQMQLNKRNKSMHHLYPQKTLEKLGVPKSEWDANANLAITTLQVNKSIGSKGLRTYINERKKEGDLLNADKHLDAHGIPRDVQDDWDYKDFLEARAKMMASRIKKVYDTLKS